MKTAGVVLATLALILVASRDGSAGKDKEFNVKQMFGKWAIVAGEKNGEKADPAELKKQKVTIDAEKLVLKSDEAEFVMKYTIDAKKDPVQISFEITKSPFGPGAKANGIIQVSGDEFKLCYAVEGGKAPAKFETKAASGNRLLVMKRVK
ncbi:MAG: TIGR03067 domain-containing protein [Gemmataceae bacterium]